MSDKTVFVTGGTGLLGSYLLRYLVREGYSNIRAFRRQNSPTELVNPIKEKIQWIEGDVLDVFALEDALKGVSQVYHCAAVVSHKPSDHKEMMEVNKEGTANLVNACLQEGIDKLVHVSSIAAIGRRKKLKVINENTKWERSSWNSQYAISKYQSEMEVWRGAAEGLNIAIVNPSVILGSGFWNYGVGPLFKRIWEGFRYFPVGATGYVDARDVARFMIKLMESDISNERYILNAANLSYREFFNLIAKILDKKTPNIEVGNFAKELAWRLDWLKSNLTGSERLITKNSATHTSRTFIYQSQKSTQVFDFQYLPIEKTIAEMGNQFKNAANQQWKPDFLPLT
ncbi:MAG: NAD-dependent epimerase/dehydratase family protein [Bacteroidetes bacterium]|jgi:nucleoside-diphosphate-sugar epimerase|nr:NAD-dependent epimerase/dehydratase family protein [Bacteroidota bacterium]MDF1866761.1 NAD-dependent epimerase/dehydratase family protein [Saprospiraceae bacterium]